MTVADNVGFGMRIKKQPKSVIQKRVGELLELINMPEKGRSLPVSASGGQQQRVALARRWPSSHRCCCSTSRCRARRQDPRRAAHEIRAIQRQLGITTVYVTHDQEEALALSDGSWS
jgi:ABC-type Fe3+/spermidine/putrescine transport system ATPase subunit